jgi:hypothetical protein
MSNELPQVSGSSLADELAGTDGIDPGTRVSVSAQNPVVNNTGDKLEVEATTFQPVHHIHRRPFGFYQPVSNASDLAVGRSNMSTDYFLRLAFQNNPTAGAAFTRKTAAQAPDGYRSFGKSSAFRRQPSPVSIRTDIRLQNYRGRFLSLRPHQRRDLLLDMQKRYGFKIDGPLNRYTGISAPLPKYIRTVGNLAPSNAPHRAHYNALKEGEYGLTEYVPYRQKFTLSHAASRRVAKASLGL